MKEYLKKLRQYIFTNPIRFDEDCDHPALDSLYWHYAECHNMSNDATREAYHALNECLSDLSLQENGQVLSLVGTLCAEHERIAFFAGLWLGTQLMLELSEDTEK